MEAGDRGRLRREVLALIGLVIAVDAVFIGGYFLAGITGASGTAKAGYTAVWTGAVLLVVLRGLSRVRAERVRRRRQGSSRG